MGAKAIIARSTSKTRIPGIRKPSAALKEKKGYLRKPEFVKIVDTVKAKSRCSVIKSNDENKPLTKSQSVNCNVAKNVPITPHRTRTGKVYKRLSTIFAHQLPRHSLLLASTPLSLKCVKESNNIKPINEPAATVSSNEVWEDIINVPKDAATTSPPIDAVNLILEEEINRTIEKVPNLDDIPEPQALISFNSTFNESFDNIMGNNDHVKVTDIRNSVERVVVKNNDQPDTITINCDTDKCDDAKDLPPSEKTGEEPSDEVVVPQKLSSLKILPKLPELIFEEVCVPSASTPRKSLSISPESSPLIPRIDPLKIFQSFKGFVPLNLGPLSSLSSEEVSKPCGVEMEDKTDPENIHSAIVSSDCVEEETKSKEYMTDVQQELSASTCLKESNTVEPVNEPTATVLSDDVVPESSKDAKGAIEVIDLVSDSEEEKLIKPAIDSRRRNPRRSQRLSLAPNSFKRVQKSNNVKLSSSDEAVSEITSVLKDENDSAAVTSSNSTDNLVQEKDEENLSAEPSSTHYEPQPKKGRRRTGRFTPIKKSPIKSATPSPQKPSSSVSDESTGLEVINGKVYATIKRPKNGKKGIPLTIEVHSSLLIEPKESCMKKATNQSWNGKKHFRWADWTKDNELINIREFESDEKYGLRKSTKTQRFKDPYDDE